VCIESAIMSSGRMVSNGFGDEKRGFDMDSV
jgi:hypothetical protein